MIKKFKLKDVPIESKVTVNGNTAIVLHHGQMGTRVNITEVKDPEATTKGETVWSNLTCVTMVIKQ